MDESRKYILSPSTLNLFRECPRCFWLKMKRNIKRPTGPMSSIPIKMDSIIKNYFNRYRGSNQLPPILNGGINGRLAINMPKTLKCTLNDGFELWGRPDDYLEINRGNIVPLDHKTRSNEPYGIHPAYQLQIDVYSYLLRAMGYCTLNKAYLSFFYPSECDLHNGLPFYCKIVELETNPFYVFRIIKEAFKVLKEPIPDPGTKCGYCRWKVESV